jgi:hypothetical protein
MLLYRLAGWLLLKTSKKDEDNSMISFHMLNFHTSHDTIRTYLLHECIYQHFTPTPTETEKGDSIV